MSATEEVASTKITAGLLTGRMTAITTRPKVYARHQRESWLVAVAILVGASFVLHSGYALNLATNACLYGILAVGFFYQFVLAGQFSFATPVFYAVGAYSSIWVTQHSDFLVGMVAAAVVTGLLGVALKLVLARSPLIHFAIATLAFGTLGIIILQNWQSLTGGDQGKYGISAPELFGYRFATPTRGFVLVGAVLLFGVALALLFERSPAQRDLTFARDMGVVARTVGLRTLAMQARAFGIGAAYMGVAGCLYASTAGFVTTASFDNSIALQVLLMVLFGGTGTVWGSVIGAVVLYDLQNQALQRWVNYQDLIFAVFILLVIIVVPGGLASIPRVVRRRFWKDAMQP